MGAYAASKVMIATKKVLAWPHAPPHWLFSPGTFMVTGSNFQKRRLLHCPALLDIVTEELLQSAERFGWVMRAWAVLANHYHFVAQSPEGSAHSLREWLCTFHRDSATRVNSFEGLDGRKVWMNFRDTRLSYQKSYLARLKYVHQNPVRHGLVEDARQYRWCSAAWFDATAPQSFRESVARFRIDQVKVPDDFD
jgi:putative transposase